MVQAWDLLQREKVAARTTVGRWTIEFVPRKAGERSAGDCYAKSAGLPRVRSRVALLTRLGIEETEKEAASKGEQVGQGSEARDGDNGAPNVHVDGTEMDEAISSDRQDAAGEGVDNSRLEEEAAPVAQIGEEELGSTAESGGQLVEHEARPPKPAGEGSSADHGHQRPAPEEEGSGRAAEARPAKVRRPRGSSIEVWGLTHGGFGDGDTAMSPIRELRRARD